MIGFLFIPLIAFLLLVVGARFSIHGLILDRTVKVSDFPTLLATILVAYVLQYVLLRRGQSTETEKQLLTDQVSEVLEAFGEARQVIIQNVGKPLSPTDAVIVTQALDECGEALSSLEFCLGESHCKELAPQCHKLGDTFIAYKRAITGGNYPATPIAPADLAQSSNYRSQINRDLRLLSLKIGKV